MDKETLAFGEETRLGIIFETKAYYNSQTKSAAIYTNEAWPDSTHRLFISAYITVNPDSTYPIVITPYKFDISQFGDVVRDSLGFQIKNVSERNIMFTVIDYPADLMTIHLPTVIPPGTAFNGYIKLTSLGAGIEFEKSVTIEVNDPASSRFTIPVKRQILALPS